MTDERQPESKFLPKPWVAIVITAVLLALTIQDQLSSGEISLGLILADVLLVMFWSGQGIDGIVSRWLGR